jgi:hypothetical protein
MLDRTSSFTANGFRVLAWPAPAATQINPYVSLVYSEFEQAGIEVRPFRTMHLGRQAGDILHVHWPEAILWGRLARSFPLMAKIAGARALKAMSEVRDNGGGVVWTVHNLAPHTVHPDHEVIWNGFFPAFRKQVDLMIGMTERSLDLVCDNYPELKSRARAIIPHPHFRTAYPPPPDMKTAREKIGLPGEMFVLGVLGSIRASKGIPQVIAAFRQSTTANTRTEPAEVLLVSGDCASETEYRAIEKAIGNGTSTVFRAARLSPAKLAESFAAVDAILINQRTTLNSGTLLLGLSMNTPIIAPAGGSISELANEFGQDWIFTFSGELTAQKLRGLIDRIKHRSRPLIAPLEKFDPSTVSHATAAALHDAFARRRAQERSSFRGTVDHSHQ